MMNAKWHNKDMPDVLACEAATLDCKIIKAGTGTSKTFSFQKKKRYALICGGEEKEWFLVDQWANTNCGPAFPRHCMAEYKDREKGKLYLFLGSDPFFSLKAKTLVKSTEALNNI